MVGAVQSTQISAVSTMTLALFEDSGWYVADYEVLGPRCFYDARWCRGSEGEELPKEALLWGQGRGCGFVSGRCNQRAWDAPGYFCSEYSPDGALSEGCTLGRRALGFCTLTQMDADVPVEFQYFSNPRLGGKVMEDYCPVWQAYNDWDCRFAPADPTRAASIAASTSNKGEQRCEDCRCFRSTLFNSSIRYVTESYFGCYEHRCVSSTQLQLRIAGTWYDCNSQSGTVRVDGWTGSLPCPNATELCLEAEDLGWPSLLGVVPSTGSHLGGTLIVISGYKLTDNLPNGSVLLPSVFICGVHATGVALMSTNGDVDMISATTATPPELNYSCRTAEGGVEPLVSGNHSCHVRVSKVGGRYGQAFGAFTYINPSPRQRPIDISCGWTLDITVRIAMRVWPYVMTTIVAIFVLHLMHEVATRKMMLHRVIAARLREASQAASEHSTNTAL